MVAYLDEAPRIGVHRIAIVQCDGRWFSPIDTHIEYKLDDSFKVCDINYIRTPHPVSPTCAWDEEGKKVYVCYISLFSNSWKSRAPRPSTTETAPRDENLYDGDRLGSSPTSTQISHNFDYFMFGVLVEETWNNMVVEAPNMSRELPFAIFQHAMVEYLNAYLLRMHKFDNGDSLLDFVHQDLLLAIDSGKYKIPIPIYEYIVGIGKSFTTTGESIRINLPAPAIIQAAVDGAAAGSFGVPTVLNHNVYETNFSPLVTARLVEQTIAANTGAANRQNRFADCNPFPVAWVPAAHAVNENLLGFFKILSLSHRKISSFKIFCFFLLF
jgi:hypothetical protein